MATAAFCPWRPLRPRHSHNPPVGACCRAGGCCCAWAASARCAQRGMMRALGRQRRRSASSRLARPRLLSAEARGPRTPRHSCGSARRGPTSSCDISSSSRRRGHGKRRRASRVSGCSQRRSGGAGSMWRPQQRPEVPAALAAAGAGRTPQYAASATRGGGSTTTACMRLGVLLGCEGGAPPPRSSTHHARRPVRVQHADTLRALVLSCSRALAAQGEPEIVPEPAAAERTTGSIPNLVPQRPSPRRLQPGAVAAAPGSPAAARAQGAEAHAGASSRTSGARGGSQASAAVPAVWVVESQADSSTEGSEGL